MTRDERIFRVIAVAAFGMAMWSLLRREIEIKYLKEINEELVKIDTEFNFAVIAHNYEGED